MTVLSTYGSKSECGLTEVDILDQKGTIITIMQSIKVFNSPLENQHQLLRLIDGYTYTVDDKHMWSCNLPLSNDKFVKIEFTFLTVERVGGIRIWNYNKSLLDSRIG